MITLTVGDHSCWEHVVVGPKEAVGPWQSCGNLCHDCLVIVGHQCPMLRRGNLICCESPRWSTFHLDLGYDVCPVEQIHGLVAKSNKLLVFVVVDHDWGQNVLLLVISHNVSFCCVKEGCCDSSCWALRQNHLVEAVHQCWTHDATQLTSLLINHGLMKLCWNTEPPCLHVMLVSLFVELWIQIGHVDSRWELDGSCCQTNCCQGNRGRDPGCWTLVHGDVGQRHRVGPKVVLIGPADRSCWENVTAAVNKNMLSLTVVEKMLTLKIPKNQTVEFFKLLNSELSKKSMLWITDMLCGTCTYTSPMQSTFMLR